MPTWQAVTPEPKEVMSQGGRPSASGRDDPRGSADLASAAAAEKEESFGTPSAPEVAGTKKRLTSAKAMPVVTATLVELPVLDLSEGLQPVEVGIPLVGTAAAVAVEETELVDSSGLVSTVSSELLSSEPSGADAGVHFTFPSVVTGVETVVTATAPETP